MKVHFIGAQRNPNGKIVASLAWEFEPEEWNAFAIKMHDAYDENDKPIDSKVLRVFSEVLSSSDVSSRSLVVPVEHVTRSELRNILSGKGRKRKLPGE